MKILRSPYIAKRHWEFEEAALSKTNEMVKRYDDVIDLSIGDPDYPAAVSYTHLQTQLPVYFYQGIRENDDHQHGEHVGQSAHDAVSYTHLDVYKRQK